ADEQAADRAERGALADVVGVVLDVDLAVDGVAADEDERVDLDYVVARERLEVVPVRLGGVRVGVRGDVEVNRHVGLSHSSVLSASAGSPGRGDARPPPGDHASPAEVSVGTPGTHSPPQVRHRHPRGDEHRAMRRPGLRARFTHTTRGDGADAHETEVFEIEPGALERVFVAPPWLRDAGLVAWLLVGIVLVIVGLVWLLALTSTIVIPVITATLIASVTAPLVGWLRRRGVPRGAGAALMLLLIVALGAVL